MTQIIPKPENLARLVLFIRGEKVLLASFEPHCPCHKRTPQTTKATRITTKHVETLKHDEAKRKNTPSAEQQSFVQQEQASPKQIHHQSPGG